MLVDDGHTQFCGQFPAVFQVGVAGMRTGAGRTHDDNLGMSFGDALVDITETLCKFRCNLLLVAQTQILQVEGSGMAGIGTHLSPFRGGGVAVGPLNQVESFAHPLVHLRHRYNVLSLRLHAPSSVGALTRHTAGQDGQRLHIEVFAELEILVVTKSHRLVVAPRILQAFTLLLRTDGGLPAIGVPHTVAATVYDATAREAHEFGLEVSQRLHHILAKAVTVVGILGHQRHHIYIQIARLHAENLQGCLLAVGIGGEYGLKAVPVLAVHIDVGLSQQFGVFAPPLRLHQGYAYQFGIASCIAHEDGEIVFVTSFDRDTVETVILQAETLPAPVVIVFLHTLCVQTHIGGIVGVYAVVHTDFRIPQRMSRTYALPCCGGSPAVALGGIELKRTVLHEFGI